MYSYVWANWSSYKSDAGCHSNGILRSQRKKKKHRGRLKGKGLKEGLEGRGRSELGLQGMAGIHMYTKYLE